MKKTLGEKLREIITYHGDEGTSGYCLSNEQIAQVEELIAQTRTEQHTTSFSEGYKAGTDEMPDAYQKGMKEGREAEKGRIKEGLSKLLHYEKELLSEAWDFEGTPPKYVTKKLVVEDEVLKLLSQPSKEHKCVYERVDGYFIEKSNYCLICHQPPREQK